MQQFLLISLFKTSICIGYFTLIFLIDMEINRPMLSLVLLNHFMNCSTVLQFLTKFEFLV